MTIRLPLPLRAAIVAACLAASGAQAIEAGNALPLASVPSADSGAVTLVDGKARATYIDFWASWCGPCRRSFPWMNHLQQKFGAQGLRIVAINVDSKRSDANDFLAQVPAKFELAYDARGDVARRFGVETMPSSVLVGGDGKVIAVHQGFRDEDEAALEARIAAALHQ